MLVKKEKRMILLAFKFLENRKQNSTDDLPIYYFFNAFPSYVDSHVFGSFAGSCCIAREQLVPC